MNIVLIVFLWNRFFNMYFSICKLFRSFSTYVMFMMKTSTPKPKRRLISLTRLVSAKRRAVRPRGSSYKPPARPLSWLMVPGDDVFPPTHQESEDNQWLAQLHAIPPLRRPLRPPRQARQQLQNPHTPRHLGTH